MRWKTPATTPAQFDGSVGVYGASLPAGICSQPDVAPRSEHVMGQGITFEMVSLTLQNDKDYLATRVAHQFNLRGPR